MARKKSEGRETLWRGILRRQAESGLSICRFCAAEGISESSFYAWRKKLRERQHGGTRTRQSRGREEVVSDDAQLFVPLKLLETAATLEIVHPLGCRIQVTGEVNPVALRQVIKALDESGAR
jgi:transposase-like protein